MRVCIVSAFRNAELYIPRYYAQISALKDLEPMDLYLLLGVGDSVDNSRRCLIENWNGLPAKIIEVSHGGPEHGSVVHPVRFKNLAFAWNKLWSEIPKDCDYVVFLEADLVWKPEAMLTLLKDAELFPAVSPMIMCNGTTYPANQFYDIWAFRRCGKNFNPFPPYYEGGTQSRFIALQSSGSCIVMQGMIARDVKFTDEEVVVGLCNQIRENGYSIFLDNEIYINHP